MTIMTRPRPVYYTGRYPQTLRTFYTAKEGLPAGEVSKLAAAPDGTVWVGTAAGIACLRSGVVQLPHAGDMPSGVPLTLLYVDRRGDVWSSAGDGLFRYRDGTFRREASDDAVLAMAEDGEGRLFAATARQLLVRDDEGWRAVAEIRHGAVRDLAAFGDGRVYLASDRGLFALRGKRARWFDIPVRPEGLASGDVRCLAADAWGHVWIGTAAGVCIYDDGNFFYRLDGKKGMPYEDIRVMARGRGGERWFGTPRGAIRLQGGQWKYYASRRWLPHDDVLSIAEAADGAVWIGTRGGIARLETRRMTLEEKANHYDQVTERFHKRFHYVTGRKLSEPEQLSSGRVGISDNDGLWTAMYVAAHSYRYAVTGDESSRERARQSVHAMMDLLKVTGRPGFFARAVCHRTEPPFGRIEPRHEWHLSTDGEWEWKGETSSDETVGHFYAYAVYYDLAADADDKERIRACVREIMNHVLDHGYCLTDLDGEPTTWAVWSPDTLNHDAKWWEQTGINSLELLSFLRTAMHIAGDERYGDVYRELIVRHRYALNTLEQKITFLGKHSGIDDNLGFHVYLPLLMYETDPDLRLIYTMSLEHHWQYERPERSPLWNAIYGALTGRECDIEAAVRSLAEMPLDLICYRTENSHRADIKLDAEHEAHGYRLSEHPLPFDERPMHLWDKTPYLLDGGSGEHAESGCVYLHPYWLARYFGLIAESEPSTFIEERGTIQ